MKQKKLLSQRHPALYFIAVWARRIMRYRDWYFGNKKYAHAKSGNPLAYRIKKHQSVLLKKLGDSDMQLQINKVTNLKIDGQFYRKNEIWRNKILKFESGKIIEEELLTKNFARVAYTPEGYTE